MFRKSIFTHNCLIYVSGTLGIKRKRVASRDKKEDSKHRDKMLQGKRMSWGTNTCMKSQKYREGGSALPTSHGIES